MIHPVTRGWRLSELLAGVAPPPPEDPLITGLAVDSRSVRQGDLFFARPGTRVKGEAYIEAAVAAGAAAVVAQESWEKDWRSLSVPLIRVPEVRECLGTLADRFFGAPSRRLRVIGVTGTNGKTSVCHYLAQALTQWTPEPGPSCGLLGTLGYGLYGELQPAEGTTPDVLVTHRLLAEMYTRGARYAVMEASSHGLDQGRVNGIAFHTAIFTNLSRDHLDYHEDMAAYGAAKARLFQTPGLHTAIINSDDPFGRSLLAGLPVAVKAVAYSLDPLPAAKRKERPTAWTVHGHLVSASAQGLKMRVETPLGQGECFAPLFGRLQASNLLAVIAALLVQGVPLEEALASLGGLRSPAGRMQRFGGSPGQPLVIVDYAHSPEALAAVLKALREQCPGSLWCVFGCGGERDRGKRPLMGAIAAGGADVVVVTDDNPRSEDGQQIIDDILAGIRCQDRVYVERDRSLAVRRAIEAAQAGDMVLIAGKGHETYQETGGIRKPYSDASAVQAVLETLQGGRTPHAGAPLWHPEPFARTGVP
jgi:UDP-N-acetylmuramoyl-L-alanyl-D-glutamate--2,6-diaminopimelate ligase